MTSPKRSTLGSGTVAPPVGNRCDMRRCAIWPVRTNTTSPGSTVTRPPASGVEIRRGDGVPTVEDGGVLGPGHVEQHAPADERVHEMDPETARPRRVDRRCRVAVVERAAVAHVRQSVPVRGALQRHEDNVLVGADPFGVVGQRHVHIRHGAHGVEAAPARHPSGSPRPPTGPGPRGRPGPCGHSPPP